MVRYSATRLCVAALIVALTTACTTTPTSPSQTAPPMAMAALQQLAIPVPSGIAAPSPTALGASRFVTFGDSITWGTLSSYDGRMLYDGSPSSYAVRLQLALNTYHAPQRFTVINRGLPGETASAVPGSRGGVGRLDSVLVLDRPQAVLLLEGINDLAGDITISQTIAALQRMIDISLQRNIPVIIATMFQTYVTEKPATDTAPPAIHPNAADLVPEFNRRIRQLAGRPNVALVDLELVFGGNRSLLGGDGLHPTDEGYDRMASAFLTAIERTFPIRGSFQ
jgi:lysophospholipase L1-like esterase